MKRSVTLAVVTAALLLVTLVQGTTPANYQVPGAVIPGGFYLPSVTNLQYCKSNDTCFEKPEVMKAVNN